MKHTHHEPPPCPDSDGHCRCRRTGRELEQDEYNACPYRCTAIVAQAANRAPHTCDFVQGRDPVHFGFPEGFGRHLHA